MIAVVDNVTTTNGKKKDGSPWQRWAVKCGTHTYATFDPQVGRSLVAGKAYDFALGGNDQYQNDILGVKEIAEGSPEAVQAHSEANDKEQSIQRGGFTHDAAAVVSAQIVAGELKDMTTEEIVTKVLEVEDGLFQGVRKQMGL